MELDAQTVPVLGQSSSEEGQLEIFSCDICSKVFNSHLNLTIHKQTHENDSQYKCSYCGKTFARRSYWRVHELGHSRPFRCELCNQSFTRQYNLTVHLRVHTGEKPFQCEECGQSFTRQYTLVLHRRMHSGEKPHECPVCGKRFSRMQTMRSHAKTHSSALVCSKCNVVFPTQDKLERHFASHFKGDKPYICNICGFRCSFSSSLQKHKQKHTREKATPPVPPINPPAKVPEVMHPAQVTRLEQSIGFLRDQHGPSSLSRPTESADGPPGFFPEMLPSSQAVVVNTQQSEPNWVVLNDGRIVPGMPPIEMRQQRAGQRSYPSHPHSATARIMNQSTGCPPGRGNDIELVTKQEEGASDDNQLMISNICSLTLNTNVIDREADNHSNRSQENNDGSDATQESSMDSSLNSSSLNCIEQMLQRQDDPTTVPISNTASVKPSLEATQVGETGGQLSGSKKRKASLLHGFFRDVVRENKAMDDKTNKEQTNQATSDLSGASQRLLPRESNQAATIFWQDSIEVISSKVNRDKEDSGQGENNSKTRVDKQPLAIRPCSRKSVTSSSSTLTKSWHCQHCGITFSDNVMFIIHMGCHGNQHPFQCNSCGHQCENKVDFMLHFIGGQHNI
ncbi:uncharacterized protein LOC102804832 [Saccoglossus kowalevskii]|uniref:Ikaros family zinc finger protein-like n=1 Tax=Saccoglossus kowalevskii TaxID=10224 RepID=A0ABM0MPC4_SACKO|nr:PREDICTED: ikaros family zinc finger protein-like [Saccoglossus kowalevskii]